MIGMIRHDDDEPIKQTANTLNMPPSSCHMKGRLVILNIKISIVMMFNIQCDGNISLIEMFSQGQYGDKHWDVIRKQYNDKEDEDYNDDDVDNNNADDEDKERDEDCNDDEDGDNKLTINMKIKKMKIVMINHLVLDIKVRSRLAENLIQTTSKISTATTI